MTSLATSLLWLTLCVYHESRSEPEIVQRSVAHVILNRAEQQDKTIEQVVKEPYQFSWRNDRKKRRAKPWRDEPETFLKCSIIAIQAMNEPDTTRGASHFFESRIKPKWSKKMKVTKKLGPFTFLKDKEKKVCR